VIDPVRIFLYAPPEQHPAALIVEGLGVLDADEHEQLAGSLVETVRAAVELNRWPLLIMAPAGVTVRWATVELSGEDTLRLARALAEKIRGGIDPGDLEAVCQQVVIDTTLTLTGAVPLDAWATPAAP